ncbi:MAG: segregation/condensation protein A [Clostridia bacterium]|nr:segregation/condensation protein A [Clostridia bacterium]
MLRKNFDLYEENLETYEFDLPNGEKGPLDVLLQMLDENQVNIRDIFISKITEQYLAYVRTLDKLDLERVSSFIYYASLLLDLKVRNMMQADEETQQETEEVTERFFDELERRKLLNEMRETLAEKQVVCRYFVEPEFTEADCRYCINNFDLNALVDAYLNVKRRQTIRQVSEKPSAKTVTKDRFTVLDKTKELVMLLKEEKCISFSDVAYKDASYTDSERINAFLALLELLRRQFAIAEQKEPFGEIIIKIAEGKEDMSLEEIIKGDYEDYEFKETDGKNK